jgi:hypothetical protein
MARMITDLRIRRLALAVATLSSVAFTGCTMGHFPSTNSTTALGNIRGKAFGGNQPIVGMSIYLYAAATNGYGQPSLSLLTSSVGTPADTNGHFFVTTGNDGGFSISSDYACTEGQDLYLYGVGGNPGSGANSAAGMLAVLGTCPSSGTMATLTPFVWLNEVTTAAAAYAMSGFATDATHVSDDEAVVGNTTAANAKTGMANAFANAANLVDLASGTALIAPPQSTTPCGPSDTPGVTACSSSPQANLNTVANVLAACVNTNSNTSSQCTTLRNDATSDGTPSGTVPADTATAAINMAHHPSANVSNLWNIINGQPAFVPYVSSAAPADYTLSLLFPFGAQGSTGMAADSQGNVFASFGGSGIVYRITPAGVITTASTAVPQAKHLAVDANDKVVVPSNAKTAGPMVVFSNDLSTSTSFFDATGSTGDNDWTTGITPGGTACAANTFTSNATTPTGSFPANTTGGSITYSQGGVAGLTSIAITASNSYWLDGQKGAAYLTDASGDKLNCIPDVYIGGSGAGTFGVAINKNGKIALTGGSAANAPAGANVLYIYNSDGTSACTTTVNVAKAVGIAGLSAPHNVVADDSGHFWVSNNSSGTISVIDENCNDVSSGGFITGSAATEDGEMDGAGNFWTGNLVASGTGKIYGLSASGSAIATYTAASNDDQYFAADESGNLWYGANKFVGEMIGVSVPKPTPIVVGLQNGKLSNRP